MGKNTDAPTPEITRESPFQIPDGLVAAAEASQQVRQLLEELHDGIGEAMQTHWEHHASAAYILEMANDCTGEARTRAADREVLDANTAYDLGHEVCRIDSLLEGAHAIGCLKAHITAMRELTTRLSDLLDTPAIAWPKAPPEPDNFRRGMDLALKMLREASAFDDFAAGECCAQRRHRGGKPHNSFTLGHLQSLIAMPFLAEGFAAVLSAFIGEGVLGDQGRIKMLLELVDVPAAEYQPGRPGDDGTEPAVLDPEDFERDQSAATTEESAPAQPASATADWCAAVVPMLEGVAEDLGCAGDDMADGKDALPCSVYAAGSFAEYLAEDIRSTVGKDPGTMFSETLDDQSARLETLCQLVELLHGLAASQRGRDDQYREGVKKIAGAQRAAIHAKALFDAGVELLPRERVPHGATQAEPAQQQPHQAANAQPAITWSTGMDSRCPAAEEIARRACWDMGMLLGGAARLVGQLPMDEAEPESVAYTLGALIRRMGDLQQVHSAYINDDGLPLWEAYDAVHWTGHLTEHDRPELDAEGNFIGRVSYV